MKNWICISKEGEDPFIEKFAQGCGVKPVDSDKFVYEDSNDPIVLRGILKKKIIKRCWNEGRTFYYMDTGYFGNEISSKNPNGWKYWHRIVKNNLQHGEIVERPSDRWESFNIPIKPWKKDGRKILIAKPDEKPMKFYGLDADSWIKEVVDTIKSHTDRPIEIRERAKNRIDRVSHNTLKEALDDDVFALVTFNSNAATESILHGIPVFTLASVNAADPVSSKDLTKIDTPYYPDKDKIFSWACHLAYGQFHTGEFVSGQAQRMLIELW
jgi:hypothetical protein